MIRIAWAFRLRWSSPVEKLTQDRLVECHSIANRLPDLGVGALPDLKRLNQICHTAIILLLLLPQDQLSHLYGC